MTRIQNRRATAAQWTTVNPTLNSGEIGFETDTGKFKFGNGVTAWLSRPYASVTTAELAAAINAVLAGVPAAMDTLDEISAALGDDPNFAATIIGLLANKQPLDADLTAIALLTTTTYGRSLLTQADAAAARATLGLGNIWADVTNFGAIGNGVAADGPAIQALINAVSAAGGGTVFIPEGTFNHTGLVLPDSDTTGAVSLEGAGHGATILMNTHATNTSIDMVSTSWPPGGRAGRIRGLQLRTSAGVLGGSGQIGIDMKLATYFSISDVRIQYHGTGLRVETCWAGTIDNVTIAACTDAVYFVAAAASTPFVFNNLSTYGCTNGVTFLGTSGTNVAFHGGTINATTGPSLYVQGFSSLLGFFGVMFAHDGVDDSDFVVLGDASEGPSTVLFSNCGFYNHNALTRAIYFRRGTKVTLDTCRIWTSSGAIGTGIQVGSGAGQLALISCYFTDVTTHVTTPTGSYQVPFNTALWTASGFGENGPRVNRMGPSVSHLRQITNVTSSATPAINVDTTDVAIISFLTVDITNMTTNLTGTPFDGQELEVRIRDNGTPRAIAWGASFTLSAGIALPTKTINANGWLYCRFVYNSVTATWRLQDSNIRGASGPTTVKSAAYTALVDDLIPVNAAGGAVTITLPTAPTDRASVTVKKIDSSANAVTVAAGGADVFDLSSGAATYSLPTQFATARFQYYAASAIWYVVSVDSGLFPSAAATAGTVATRTAQANLAADAFLPGFTTIVSAGGTTTLTNDSTQVQEVTGTLNQTITLPTTGIPAGHQVCVVCSTSGIVTVNSSAGSLVASCNSNAKYSVFTALVATPTSSTHWAVGMGFTSGPSQSPAAFNAPIRDGNSNLFSNRYNTTTTTTPTAGATTALTVASAGKQIFTGALTQTVTLPTTSVTVGSEWEITNLSTDLVTVNASGGTLVRVLGPGDSVTFMATQATPTTNAHWLSKIGGAIVGTYQQINMTGALTLPAIAGRTYRVTLKSGALPTLPTAVGNTSEYSLLNASGGAINVATTSSQTINLTAPPFSLPNGNCFTFVPDVGGGGWWLGT